MNDSDAKADRSFTIAWNSLGYVPKSVPRYELPAVTRRGTPNKQGPSDIAKSMGSRIIKEMRGKPGAGRRVKVVLRETTQSIDRSASRADQIIHGYEVVETDKPGGAKTVRLKSGKTLTYKYDYSVKALDSSDRDVARVRDQYRNKRS
jgi:hypothetical protein